jgi:CxxC motif-containing protein (DUF1111 family)
MAEIFLAREAVAAWIDPARHRKSRGMAARTFHRTRVRESLEMEHFIGRMGWKKVSVFF